MKEYKGTLAQLCVNSGRSTCYLNVLGEYFNSITEEKLKKNKKAVLDFFVWVSGKYVFKSCEKKKSGHITIV